MKRYLYAALVLVLVLSLVIIAAPATLVKAQPPQQNIIHVPADNATIQMAVTYAQPGWTILVAPGIYTEIVVVNKPVTIQGEGPVKPIVTAADTDIPVFIISANDTYIKNLTITGSDNSCGVYISVGGSGTIDSCNISGNLMGIFVGSGGNIIQRNLISNNTYGLYFECGEIWNQIQYNDIVGNTAYGACAYPVPGSPHFKYGVVMNYWGDASGPSGGPDGPGPGTGDNVSVSTVWYSPWLNAGSATILSSGILDISMAIRLDVGWNSLSTPIALAGDSNNWDEIVTNSSLTYDLAYIYDADTGWSSLSTSNTTPLDPLDAILIKVSTPTLVTLKISTLPHNPGAKTLKPGWNLMGSAMSIMVWELEMWKVLVSVEHTADGKVGYDMVVSPPLASQPSWVYVRGQEEEEVGYEWQKMDFGRGYWIYMENEDEMAGFSSTPITARIWD